MKQKYIVKVIYDQCKIGQNTILQNYRGLRHYEIKPDYEYTIMMKDDDHSINDIEKKIREYEEKHIKPVYDFSKYPVNLMTAFVYNDHDKKLVFAYQVQHHQNAYSALVSTYYEDRLEDRIRNDIFHDDTYFHPEENEHYQIRQIAQLDDDIKKDKKNLFLEHLHIAIFALRSYFSKDSKIEQELATAVNVSDLLINQFKYNRNERQKLKELINNKK